MQRNIREFLASLTPQSLLGDISHMISPERFGHRISDRILWKIKTSKTVAALTFDDGPNPSSTPQLLDVLSGFNVPATFFLVGSKVEAHPELAKKIVDNGHEIGNHSFSHSILSLINKRRMRREISQTDQLLRELNTQPRYFRPPVGLFSRHLLDMAEEFGYIAVIGNVYPRDPHSLNKDKIVKRVIDRTQKGSIIILHDGGNSDRVDRSHTIKSVEEIIPRLREKGFSLLSLSEMIKLSDNSGKSGQKKTI